ncbi:metallophosphatase [Bacteroidia bacterium]|nr:metallophosphatase [Bacteroidia bacterium]
MPKIGFLLVIVVYLLINFYVYLHGRWALPAHSGIQGIYLGLFILCAASFFVGMLLSKFCPWQVGAVFSNIGGWWLLIALFYLLLIVVFTDLLRLAQHFIHFYPAFVTKHYAFVKLIYFCVALAIPAIATVVGHHNFTHPQVVTLNLEVAPKKSLLDNLKIVAVSDIHLGEVVRKKQLQRYVNLINEQQPDIIFIVGDLIDRSLAVVQAQGMAQILQQLHAHYGCYAVLGNHDYHAQPDAVLDFMRDAGIIPLRDTAVVVDNNFIVAGRDDYSNRERKPLSAFVDSSLALPVVLLDHQPAQPAESVKQHIDLQISGHTHNGQIFPLMYVVKKIYNIAYGYKKVGDTHFYVSSGLGLWGAPIRIGTQSEVVCVNLKFANALP